MFVKFSIIAASLCLVPAALAGVIVPRRNTPNFYLVAVNSDPLYHLKPVRANNYFGTLSGSGDILKFYLDGEGLSVDTPNDPNGLKRALIDSVLGSTGCSVGGKLGFVTSSSSNKCARYAGFYLSSYDQNAQLGARLIHDWAEGFYVCTGGEIRYENSGAPAGCVSTNFWTIPATV